MINFTNSIPELLIKKSDKSWNYSRQSYAQEAEDLILANYLEEKTTGFYIDVGACHPFRFSNTYYFYRRGWNGINVDATPGSMVLFKKYRPRDVNLELGVSNTNKKINYYIFNEPALNGFSEQLSKERNAIKGFKIEKVVKIKPVKLSELLDKYLTSHKKIDFMSIDVEAYEYEVLLSNNWKKYLPGFILVEISKPQFKNLTKNKVYLFLKSKGYEVIAFTGRTLILKRK